MTDEYAPSEESFKVAEEGIRGMLNCVGGEMVSPDVRTGTMRWESVVLGIKQSVTR